MNKKLSRILIAIGVCLIIGSISGGSTARSLTDWFTTLEKPIFNPPGWLFGPVWTVLYIMMGIAAGRVWALGMETKGVRRALSIFGIQLLLNFMWSIIFFGLREIAWALVDIALLLLMIILTMRTFKPLDRMAYLLLWPYLLWVSFATTLNASILYLNM